MADVLAATHRTREGEEEKIRETLEIMAQPNPDTRS